MSKFNLNLSDTAYADINEMAERLDISMADVVREAVNLYRWVSRQFAADNYLLIRSGDQTMQLLLPELERYREQPAPLVARRGRSRTETCADGDEEDT